MEILMTTKHPGDGRGGELSIFPLHFHLVSTQIRKKVETKTMN